MTADFRTLTAGLVNIGALVLVMVYLCMVAMGYATEGPRYQFRFDITRPAGSLRRLLVGLGVRFTAGVFQFFKRAMNPLFEASAQVGDWVAQRSGEETRQIYRSRFM